MSDANNALVKPDANDPVRALSSFLGARAKNLAKYAAARTKPDTLIRLAVFEFSQNEWLRRCTPESIYGSLVLAAQMGLEPSGIRGEAYLVPFKGRCTLIPGWRGYVKLALRSTGVKSIYSHVVYERDIFRVWLGSEQRIEHEPSLETDRGGIIAAYAVAKLANGELDVEVMTRGELEHVKKVASDGRGGKAGPAYAEWEDQMFRKAPLRRLAKRLPLGDDFFAALKAEELAEAGESNEKIQGYIDAEIVSEATEPPKQGADSIADRVAARADKARNE